MEKRIPITLLTSLSLFSLNAQIILVEPYLQDAEPESIKILWETNSGTTNTVEWGTVQNNLNQSATASSITTQNPNLLHEASLTGLVANTRYYYKTISDNTESEVFDFITPPLKSSNQSFNLVAMSDMQKDGAFPLKFQEVVNDGIIDYFEDNYGPDIPANLGFVMIPGDLVANGNSYSQWQNDFFGQAENLFTRVPVYPVLGNHENNSAYYFQYFTLPENGTIGYEEHWWYKDYSNVRIIGLNSNSGYRIQAQLDWLAATLSDACNDDDIDFVFAQLHHPHKSELWTPGEISYTGSVITQLEDFSTDCGKPSIHFFGHTHGYSRGQSLNDMHLWVNVATAGGAIDNWGEFPNADYEEFSNSIDEYGFVVLNVDAGADPEFTLTRVTRGDQDMVIDNEEQDILTIRKNETSPDLPSGVFPDGETVSPDCFILEANAFSDPGGDTHQASQWQISTDCNDFSNPVFDSWKQNENWYNEVNTQAGDALTDEEVHNLDENTTYCWRVRYRDEHLAWSNWSTPLSFETGVSNLTANLMLNEGAEDGINDWIIETGIIESLTNGECNGIAPHSGTYYFAVGGLCDGNETAYSEVFQKMDVSTYSTEIDAGSDVLFGGYLSNFGGSDQPTMNLEYLDASDNSLGTSEVLTTLNSSWTLLETTEVIPFGTRTIKAILTGTRNAGTDNDSYFDDLKVQLDTSPGDDCELGPLPIEMILFEAHCVDEKMHLHWEVIEQEVREYSIEHSQNLKAWEEVGNVQASSSQFSIKSYAFEDIENTGGNLSYYRLKIVGRDGGFQYSSIISGECKTNLTQVAIYPNPVSDHQLNIDIALSEGDSKATIQITNLLGQVIYRKAERLTNGLNQFSFETKDWAKGYYLVSIQSQNWQWNEKIVKQ